MIVVKTIMIIWTDPKLSTKSFKKILSRFLKRLRSQISLFRTISATAESQIVQKNTVIVTGEGRPVVASATALIVTIAPVTPICKKILIQNPKRRPNSSDLFIFFI